MLDIKLRQIVFYIGATFLLVPTIILALLSGLSMCILIICDECQDKLEDFYTWSEK